MAKIKKKERLQIKKWIEKWRPRLFLGEWFFYTSYTDDDNGICAECRVDAIYLTAKILIHKPFWDASLKDQEMMIVHEMSHCISEESYKLHLDSLNFKLVTCDHLESVRERLTQRITNIAFQQEWVK